MRPYRIALVGQLNSGKSTLFNNLAGFKTLSGNFPGTTVSYTISKTRFGGREIEVIDLPGIYSLSYSDIAEKVARDFLLREEIDVIINVVDASVLTRSLELTLQLLELEKPLILCLNMVDEARRKGMEIDEGKLSEILGVPVVSTVAVRGIGIVELMETALRKPLSKGKIPQFHKDIENAISKVEKALPEDFVERMALPSRFLAIRLLEGEEEYISLLKELPRGEEILEIIRKTAKEVGECHGAPISFVISSERHALSLNIFEEVCKIVHPPKERIDDKLDRYLMHPIGGYFFLFIVLGIVFLFVFKVGNLIGDLVLSPFEGLSQMLQPLGQKNLFFSLLEGLIEGIAGGIGIVLPYLVPLIFFISLLEDVGYLPRAAFLLDGLFHRIGLHGKSVIPFVLGYGCNVPALVATRILDSPIDRIITSLLVSFIPCSARSVVILALVGAYLGAPYAFALYFFNLLVIALLGKLLRGMFPGSLEAFIMDIPTYKLPPIRYIGKKTWFRLYEFVVFAWPLIIFASLIMSLLSFYRIDNLINALFAPLTVGALGLPKVVGTTLFFGILRKELTLILLANVLGTTNIPAVLSHLQILVFTTFVLFYIPCVSFIVVMWKEIGGKYTIISILLSLTVATIISALIRALGTLFL
ncbi:MAG: ferrous iron transport protein B [bacterium]